MTLYTYPFALVLNCNAPVNKVAQFLLPAAAFHMLLIVLETRSCFKVLYKITFVCVFFSFIFQVEDRLNEPARYSLIFFFFGCSSASSLAHVLPLNATRAATAKRRPRWKVDMLLRIQTHDERRNIHHLFANSVKKQISTW